MSGVTALPRLMSAALWILLTAPVVDAQNATGTTGDNRRALTISQAVRTTGQIRVDGKLDEADWAKAPGTEAFTQIHPEEGKPASERTEARVLYDDDFLYVGVRLHDDGRITGRLGRRDMNLGDSD